MAVDNFFYERKLYPYLDYDLTARVFHGVIHAHFDLNTKEAKRLADELPKITVPLDDATLHTALVQIFAEKEHNLGVTGKETADWNAVREELGKIDAQPWQHIDEIDIINPQDTKLVHGSVYVPRDIVKMPARKARVTFELDASFADQHSELLLLYWHVAMLISENVVADFYATFGFYSKAMTRRPKHRATKIVHLFHIPPAYPLELPKVRDEIEDSILDLHDAKAFQRLTTELRLATHVDSERILPGPHFMYERTELLAGSKGWERIATDENCDLILSHMKVTVSTGRSRASTRIGPLLNLQGSGVVA